MYNEESNINLFFFEAIIYGNSKGSINKSKRIIRNYHSISVIMNNIWEQTQRFEKSNQELLDENEQLKQQLSDIDGQLVMLDNCDKWDYDRMKYTVREIAGIIGYNGTINPKR